MLRSWCETRFGMIETIECPYCHKAQAVKLWFPADITWYGRATTDPRGKGCECEVYVCPSCGRVSLLDADERMAPDAE